MVWRLVFNKSLRIEVRNGWNANSRRISDPWGLIQKFGCSGDGSEISVQYKSVKFEVRIGWNTNLNTIADPLQLIQNSNSPGVFRIGVQHKSVRIHVQNGWNANFQRISDPWGLIQRFGCSGGGSEKCLTIPDPEAWNTNLKTIAEPLCIDSEVRILRRWFGH
jgi:hypothetical protein